MKWILPLILLITSYKGNSQTITLPQKDGKIYYEVIDSVKGKSKDQLYEISKKWFISTFKNAKAVIQSEDKEAGTIIGKGVSSTVVGSGLGKMSLDFRYTIEINIKQGKYRMRIYDLVNVMPGYPDSETEASYARYQAGKSKKFLGDYLKGINEDINDTQNSYRKAVNISTDDF
jgi:hypothetical protein